MTTTAPKEFIDEVPDSLYSILQNKAPVNGDTNYRQANVLQAYQNGSAPIAAPLNAAGATNTTIFMLQDNSANKLRLGTIGLRLQMVFHALGHTNQQCPQTAAADAKTMPATVTIPFNAPCWSMLGRLINKVTVVVNDGEYETTTSGYFHEIFTARLLSQYSWQEMQNMSETLFLPMDDKTYSYSTNVNPTVANYMNAAYVAPAQAGAITVLSESCNSALYRRAMNYCGPNSHQIVVTKIVPLWLIANLPRDGICKNFDKCKIDIEWNSTTDLLDHLSGAGAESNGAVSLLSADMLVDYYAVSAPLQSSNLIDKTNQVFDILPRLKANYSYPFYINDTDIRIGQVKNFHSVMIFESPFFGGFPLDNGQANANLRSYANHGQYIFGQDTSDAEGALRTSMDQPDTTVGNVRAVGWSSVQITYGGRQYPANPIITIRKSNDHFAHDFTELYMEFLKAAGKFGRRDIGASIPFDIYRKTMPIIWLKPFPDNAPTLSTQEKDLIISLRGGRGGRNVHVVVFTYKLSAIGVGGNLQEFR